MVFSFIHFMNNFGFYSIVVVVMGFRDLFFTAKKEYIFKVNVTVFRSKF